MHSEQTTAPSKEILQKDQLHKLTNIRSSQGILPCKVTDIWTPLIS